MKFIGKLEEILTEDETLRNCIYSLLKGEFDKDTDSFKQTCKALKIKHTYKADIKSYKKEQLIDEAIKVAESYYNEEF